MPRLISAADLAHQHGHFPFGVDPGRVAAAMRDLADRIERAELHVQRATLIELTQQDEFATSTFSLRFLQRRPTPTE